MNEKKLQWYVEKYGVIINEYNVKIEGNYIGQKIYKFENKLYIETWCNGIKLLFNELI